MKIVQITLSLVSRGHCVESVQLQSFFQYWSLFSRIRTKYGDLRVMFPFFQWFLIFHRKCGRVLANKQHCVKRVQIRSFLLSVYSRIRAKFWGDLRSKSQREYGKIPTRKNSALGHFSHSEYYEKPFLTSII